ncbi:MAG: oligosaccharide flippase family protein [Erysipelotrichaceae bacterium]|nr:oligosaccharide flippase family protein [Erysipelotrichaceae bacterium]
MTQSRKKQSIIVGALTGTAGIFFTKALGLLYASPFQAMAGGEMIFYTSTYQIYEFMLTLSTSGIPFAIATLVAKYVAQEDYKTTMLVRKVSTMILGAFGVTLFAIVVLFSGPIVQALAPGRDALYLHKYQISLILVAFAVLTVPILSMFRGFYQGLKEMKAYAFSQVLEQFVRITFLLGMAALLIYVFRQEQIWAVYFAVSAAAVSALAAIGYFLFVDKSRLPELNELADKQEKEPLKPTEVLKEILYFAIPYFLIAIIGNCGGMINLMFVNPALQKFGYSFEEADRVYSIMNFNSYKLVSIPQILGPGFAVAIIPHITTALTLKDYDAIRGHVKKIFTSCTYIAYPVILLMILFAPQIYFIMYGDYFVELGADILRWNLCVAALWIVMTLCANTLMALQLKRFNLIWNIIDIILLVLFVTPVVTRGGYRGMYCLYMVMYCLFILMAATLMKLKFKVEFLPILKEIAKIVLSLAAIVLIWFACRFVTYDMYESGRLITMFVTGFECVLCMIGYLGVTVAMKLPETIFDIRIRDILARLTK